MKKFINGLFTSRDNRISGLIAFAIVGMMVLGCNCNKEGGFSFGEAKVPADAELEALVQSTLQDFASAAEAGDFTAFHANTASQFQNQYSKDALNSTFNVFIQKKEAVVPILRSTATMKPVYSPIPNVSRENLVQFLKVNGKYLTTPAPTDFELKYIQENGRWKIMGIVIKIQ